MVECQLVEHRTGHEAYVEAALCLLQFVEARRPTARRFGADADARWKAFRGDLETIDRIELLLRDADAEWPGAFGARGVYALAAVAEDEPFGPTWTGLDLVHAEDLWRRVSAQPAAQSVAQALHAIASTWGTPLVPVDAGAIEPTDRLVVIGPSAIAATIEAFARGTDLDWADQVTVVATPPAHRQLAAAAGALLNINRPTRFAAPGEGRGRVVASADADPSDRVAGG